MKRLPVWILCLGLLPACGLGGKKAPREPSGPKLYELRLSALREHAPAGMFDSQPPPTVQRVVRKLDELLGRPETRGLLLRLGPFEGAWDQVYELQGVIARYRDAGKPVHCHFEDTDNAGYAIAASCDRITMTPAGTLNLVGLAAQLVHARDALEELGLRAELTQVGRYKGAAEPLTRQTMSPEVRESLNAMLDQLDGFFRAGLAKREGLAKKNLQRVLDAGPYTADRARARKLVDALGYDDAARAAAKKAADAKAVVRLFAKDRDKKPSLSELLDALTGEPKKKHGREPRLLVLFALGEIMTGERPAFDRAFSEPFIDAVRKAADDPGVKAAVLRIDSPGGSALASDRMWHAVRRLAKRKPVVVSVGGMAASGGYYIAAAGREIWAAPSSLVGSIGVVGGKISAAKLAERVGVHSEVLQRGAHAAWLSPLRPFSPSEAKALRGMLEHTYQTFLRRVSEGRKLSVDALRPAAEGRIMTALKGKELGLVDQLGTLHDALARARELGSLDEDAPVELWPDADDPLAALSSALGGVHARAQADQTQRVDALRARLVEIFGPGLETLLATGDEAVLAALPYAVSVR